jgi:nitrite reductase (NADH) large subunit
MQLDRDAGLMLQKSMEQLGVKVHLGKSTTGLLGNGSITGLQFKDGSTLDCDLLVVAAGIRPNVALAKSAGLEIKRGIVVNDGMATSDPSICAVGECAEHRGMVYGLVAPLWEQTAVLADRLTGRVEDKVYEGSRTSTKLKVMGVDLAVMGEKQGRDADDEVVTFSEPGRGVYHKLIVRDGKLAGAILLGDTSAAPALQQLFDRSTPLPDSRASLLFPAGDAQAPMSAAESWAGASPIGKSSEARESGSGVLRSKSCCSAGAALVSPSRMAPASLPSRTISL